MASINKVIIVGNLGQDPSTRYMPNGEAVTNITVATTDAWKDKTSGEKREQTEWHRITFYRKLAEVAGQWLKKGASVYVEGKLQTRKWTDAQGVERYTTEVIADSMQMLGSKQSGDSGKSDEKPSSAAQCQGGQRSDMDDDIPFNVFCKRELV